MYTNFFFFLLIKFSLNKCCSPPSWEFSMRVSTFNKILIKVIDKNRKLFTVHRNVLLATHPQKFFFDYHQKTFPHSKNVKKQLFSLWAWGEITYFRGVCLGILLLKIGN